GGVAHRPLRHRAGRRRRVHTAAAKLRPVPAAAPARVYFRAPSAYFGNRMSNSASMPPVNSPPETPLLDRAVVPADLRALPESDLPRLAEELRAELVDAVSQTGGHLGAGLGVV